MNTAEEWIKKLENHDEEIFWKEAERQKFFVEVQLICNVVLISDVQQNESDVCVCVCVCVSFQVLSITECYKTVNTVPSAILGPWHSFIFYTVVYIH